MSTLAPRSKSRIKKIKVSNFKSFKDLEVELGEFNVLIGANSSGKSSFIQVFQFLKDIMDYGLDNAISLQGGVEYLRNVSLGSSANLSFEIGIDMKLRLDIPSYFIKAQVRPNLRIRITEATYRFSLAFPRRGRHVHKIVEDKLILKCEISVSSRTLTEQVPSSTGQIIVSSTGGNVTLAIEFPPDFPIQSKDLRPFYFRDVKIPVKTLLLQSDLALISLLRFSLSRRREKNWNELVDISLYDFDPKLSKRAVQITGKSELESDGRNLAIVLKNVVENPVNRRAFANFVQHLLPFIHKITVEGMADKSLLFNVEEKYYPKQYLPSSLISDGTIAASALILALFFDHRGTTIIEEPERNLHPSLIGKVVSLMEDASEAKQILITTHNPEIVRHAGLEHLLLVSRDKDGFSKIERPAVKERVKSFLQNEMDLGELYVQNLLGE